MSCLGSTGQLWGVEWGEPLAQRRDNERDEMQESCPVWSEKSTPPLAGHPQHSLTGPSNLLPPPFPGTGGAQLTPTQHP